jgi:hypothetical protein
MSSGIVLLVLIHQPSPLGQEHRIHQGNWSGQFSAFSFLLAEKLIAESAPCIRLASLMHGAMGGLSCVR